MAEARAKIELRSIATRADAIFAIELHKRTALTSKPSRSKGGAKDIIGYLRNYVKNSSKDLVSMDELHKLVSGFSTDKPAGELIELLNHKGLVIKKGANSYKIVV
jgi:DNA helicase MCM8